MITIRQRLFAALRAIQDALMIPPSASLREHQRAIAEAYGLAVEASGLENVFDSDVDADHELAWRELPD